MARWAWVAVVGGALGSAGCFSPPADAVARLAEVKAEGLRMEKALDEVEDRLLGNQGRVVLWREMAARHRGVSALACENAAEHVAAMELHRDRTNARLKRKSLTKTARAEAVGGIKPAEVRRF